MNSLAGVSDSIRSILKTSSSNSSVDILDILVILLWKFFTKISLGFTNRH